MSELTLDEAIKHCLEVAEKNENDVEVYEVLAKNHKNTYSKLTAIKYATDCAECAADHKQLAEWLQELKAYRKLRICGNCRHYVYGTTHFGECHVTSDVEPCVVGIDQTACDTFFDYKDFRSCRQFAEWLTELREAKSIIRVCNRVLGFLLEHEIESTSTRHEVETLLKNITKYLSGGSDDDNR